MGVSKVDYNGETLLDISGSTVTPETLAQGYTAYNSNGEQIVGTALFGNGDSVSGESDTLIIKATANFANFTAENISKTFAEITEAYNQGKHVMLNMDIGQIVPGQTAIIDLSVFIPNSAAVFDTVVKIDNHLYFIRGVIYPNDTGSFSLEAVAKKSDVVTEVFYVDSTFDMQTLTCSTDVTYSEILNAAQSDKQVIAKAQTYMETYNTNVIYLPLTSLNLMSGVAVFDGTMQINGENIGLEKGLVLLAVTVEVTNSSEVITRIKVVTTTTIKE